MVWWNFYFIVKTCLHFTGYMHAGFLLNLLLLLTVVITIHDYWPRAELIRRLRLAVALPLSLALFYSETWLPPVGTVYRFFADPATRPSAGYVWQFFLNSLNPWMLGGAALILAVLWLADKKLIRLSALNFVLLGAIAANNLNSPTIDTLDRFYEAEAKRAVRLDQGAGKPDFDIILIHVCSLSWDDLANSKFDARPFFSKFDYLFTDFNSATSYSNPSAARLLRAPCGQLPHDAIFRNGPQNCYLMADLRQRGYETYTVFNHEGKYEDMAKSMVNYKADPLFPMQLEPEKLSFDDAPVYSDKEALETWLTAITTQTVPVALYYNTISLHQGGHFSSAQVEHPWAEDRITRYNEFLDSLCTELDSFFGDLEASGRKAVVVFVAEHGAALIGSRLQAPDLRDIPLPPLTLVPMGIKIFGPGYNGMPVKQELIDKPVSYLALAKTLSDLMETSPYENREASTKAVLSNIPETQMVAESANAIVMKNALGYSYKPRGGNWTDLPSDIAPKFDGKRYMSEGPAVKN